MRHVVASVLLAGCVLVPGRAAAEDTVDRARIVVAMGFPLFVGHTSVDGHAESEDEAVPGIPLPPPVPQQFVGRFEQPLGELFVAGTEIQCFGWTTDAEERLGYELHFTADLGVVPKLRIAQRDSRGAPTPRSSLYDVELFAGVPLGMSMDYLGTSDDGPRGVSASGGLGFGFHAGLVIGMQFTWPEKAMGALVEAGFDYHRIGQEIDYEIDGAAAATEEARYDVFSLFLRLGLVLLP